MTLHVLKARRWQEHEANNQTLVAQFGHYDLVRDGLEPVTEAEDYELAHMAAKAPEMYALVYAIKADRGHRAEFARNLLREIHRDG